MNAALDLQTPERLGPYRVLTRLAAGGVGVVYRAEHVDSGEAVALKTLRVLDPIDCDTLRREIHALGRISHPGVVRIRGDGVSNGVPWYAMDLLDGRTVAELWASEPASPSGHGRSPAMVEQTLRLIRRLCGTLSFLHGEGIVHRDLKPANIIVRPDGRPVLVDFGLFSHFGGAVGREALEVAGEVLGTVSYMAPEQVRGEYVDARADLYSLGCILYEAVTGHPPFCGTPYEVITHHLEDAPVPPSALADVPAPLDALVLRLLAKEPRLRVGHAADVRLALDAVLGDGEDPGPAPRPYLYRPSFAGRREFLAELVGSLERADAAGQCLFLVGESGSGKTRLAMEATRAAVQRGFTVVTGDCQAVENVTAQPEAHGAPLHPFRPLLRLIADHCRARGRDATDDLLGRRGKVLAAYEPALIGLPGQSEQPEPFPLAAQAARARVLADLRETVATFARTCPLFLVLDDLQWADELTLAFLASLDAAFYAGTPLVLVATYRSEEETVLLRDLSHAPPARVLPLDRLDAITVGVIVSDMLAMQPPPETLVQFVAQESEGNPFFVAEYLRTAVTAGLLDRTAAGDWRPHVSARDADQGYQSLRLPRTLRELVGRRLQNLDGPAQIVVEAGAVLGREFDLELAAALVDLDEPGRFDAMTQLLARHVVEQGEGGRCRFAHDKVREVAYDAIPPARVSDLHGRAASALEGRHGGDADFAQRYATLAHHWTMAGVDGKALEYLGRAGAHALASGSHGDARRLLTRALALDDRLKHPTERLERTRWLRMLAEACFGAGDIEGTLQNSSDALVQLGHRVPRTRAGWAAVLGAELVRHVGHWSLPEVVVRGRRANADVRHEAAVASGQLSESFYYIGDMLAASATLLRGANLAERGGAALDKAQSYARLGYVAGAAGLPRVAGAYFRRFSTLARATGHAGVLGFGLYLEAQYCLGRAEWERCTDAGEESVRLLDRAGDRHLAEIARTILAHACYYQGCLDEARQRFQELLDLARTRANPQHVAWGTFLMGRSLLALGHGAAAVALLEEGRAALADKASLVLCDGVLAQALVRTGRMERAAEVTAELTRNLEEPLLYGAVLDGYAGAAEVHLTFWEDDVRLGRPSTHAAPAQRTCAALRRFARSFPLAQPASRRLTAWERWADGQVVLAERLSMAAVDAAKDREMPYEQALAHAQAGRFGTTERSAALHRDAATNLLLRLGCRPDRDDRAGSLPGRLAWSDRLLGAA